MAPNRHRRQQQAGVARRLAFEMAASAMIGEGMRCRIFAVIALVLLAFDVSTAASAWPDRSIKIIVPFVAGGSSDTLARILAEGLRDKLGQTVVVENRGGGGWRDWNVGGGRRSCGRITDNFNRSSVRSADLHRPNPP